MWSGDRGVASPEGAWSVSEGTALLEGVWLIAIGEKTALS